MRSLKFLLRTIFPVTAMLLLDTSRAFSQDTLIHTGTIHVGRDSAKANFVSRVQYDYATDAGKEAWWLEPQFVPYPPYPVYFDLGNSKDSAASLIKAQQLLYKPAAYNWNLFFENNCRFYFAWDDTIRMDSARVALHVLPSGKGTTEILPWNNDSVTAFEKTVSQTMKTCWIWQPARVSEENEQPLFIPCTLIFTVYAYDRQMYLTKRDSQR
jgi:hypothetical protein